jgi:hypothetical protein
MPGTYIFDPTGELPDNFIPNEYHTITATDPSKSYLFSPNASPFYRKGLSIVASNGATLTENVHYTLSLHWAQASDAIGLDVYGAINMLPRNSVGGYYINYQTVGGEYVVDKATIIADGLLDTVDEYMAIDWSTAPTSFPPTPHSLMASAMTEYPIICQALMYLSTAVRTRQDVSIDDIGGLSGFWANSTMLPLLNLMSSVNSNNSAFAEMILNLENRLPGVTPVPNIDHYEIPLNGFTIKHGSYKFKNVNIPNTLLFVGKNFPNKCLSVFCTIAADDPEVPPTLDTIRWSAPKDYNVNVSITLDPSYTGSRRVTYYAIGF